MASTSALFSPAELTFAQVPLTHSAATAHPDDEVPLRPDGRTPLQYRDLVLETGVSQAQGALGSAKVSIEDAAGAGGGGTTEVYAGVRGEIETMNEGQDGGRIVVSVEWYVQSRSYRERRGGSLARCCEGFVLGSSSSTVRDTNGALRSQCTNSSAIRQS